MMNMMSPNGYQMAHSGGFGSGGGVIQEHMAEYEEDRKTGQLE